MKREAFNHPKIRRLARLLGMRLYGARGIMESLWHVTATHAPRGDIGRLEDADIADQIDWDRKPDELIEALIECRLIDRCKEHRLVVHDWASHSDTGVRAKLRRRYGNEDFAHVVPVDGDEPVPDTPKTDSPPPPKPREKALPEVPEGFTRWWKIYPGKRSEKQRCLNIWHGRKPTADGLHRKLEPMADEIVAAVKQQIKANHWRGADGKDYIPNAGTWLYNGGWEDEVRRPAAGKTDAGGLMECGPRPKNEVTALLRELHVGQDPEH